MHCLIFFEENAIEIGKKEWIVEFDERSYKNNVIETKNVYEMVDLNLVEKGTFKRKIQNG